MAIINSPDKNKVSPGSVMTRRTYLASVKEGQDGSMSPRKNPLDLTSQASSLMKLQKAGYDMSSNLTKMGGKLAKFLNREYGDLLPKTNLTNLPDFKVTEFIKVLG